LLWSLLSFLSVWNRWFLPSYHSSCVSSHDGVRIMNIIVARANFVKTLSSKT
jgi:hypothetical protein